MRHRNQAIKTVVGLNVQVANLREEEEDIQELLTEPQTAENEEEQRFLSGMILEVAHNRKETEERIRSLEEGEKEVVASGAGQLLTCRCCRTQCGTFRAWQQHTCLLQPHHDTQTVFRVLDVRQQQQLKSTLQFTTLFPTNTSLYRHPDLCSWRLPSHVSIQFCLLCSFLAGR
jgi:hypothetical protein